MSLPNCPQCGNNKHVRQQEDKLFICDWHRMQFDGVDDGTIGYGRQDYWAERKEEFEQRRDAREREKQRCREDRIRGGRRR